jgi:uncharacterized membrane protein
MSDEQAPPPPDLTPPRLVGLVRAIEGARVLDVGARALRPLADAVTRPAKADALLRGTWLGHALHPLLTDFPLGAWTCTTLLDLFGGRRSRPAATGLLSFGVAAAIPTAASGLAEWRATEGAARRVGVVHAAVNSTALALYTGSLVSRLRGRHGKATALAVTGGVVATTGGYLGGHLSLVRKIGTADPAFRESRSGPT